MRYTPEPPKVPNREQIAAQLGVDVEDIPVSGRRKPVCAVCGMGGYWVAYSPVHGEDRCVNHLHTQERAMALDETMPDER